MDNCASKAMKLAEKWNKCRRLLVFAPVDDLPCLVGLVVLFEVVTRQAALHLLRNMVVPNGSTGGAYEEGTSWAS